MLTGDRVHVGTIAECWCLHACAANIVGWILRGRSHPRRRNAPISLAVAPRSSRMRTGPSKRGDEPAADCLPT